MQTLEDKIRAGQNRMAGVADVQLTPIPDEYTKPSTMRLEPSAADIAQVVLAKIEPTISELAEQQIKEAMIRDSVDRYKLVRDALENCLAQSQHMRSDGATAIEACKQIEQLALAALSQTP